MHIIKTATIFLSAKAMIYIKITVTTDFGVTNNTSGLGDPSRPTSLKTLYRGLLSLRIVTRFITINIKSIYPFTSGLS